MATGLSQAIIVIRAVDHVSGEARGISGAFQQLGNQIAAAGLGMVGAFTMPIVGALAAIGKLTTEYDKAMKMLETQGGSTAKEIQGFSKEILSMAGNVRQSTDTAGDLMMGLYELASVGFMGADGMTILKSTTRAATGGFADMIEVTKATAGALNAYNAGASEATHFTDVMLRSVDLGAFHFSDLVAQMGDFMPAAGMLNLAIEDVFAAFSTMTTRALKASEAGISLNRILMTFVKPSDKAAAAAAELGIDLSAESLKAKGLTGAFEDLIAKTKLGTVVTKIDKDARLEAIDAQIAQAQTALNLAVAQKAPTAALKNQITQLKAQRKEIVSARFDLLDYDEALAMMASASGASTEAIAQMFPDIRAIRGMYALATDNLEEYNRQQKILADAEGTVAGHYAIAIQSYSEQLKAFSSQAGTLGIMFGGEFLPMLLRVTGALGEVVKKFAEMDPVVKRQIVSLGLLVAAAGPLLIVFGLLIQSVASVMGAVGFLPKVLFALISVPLQLMGGMVKFVAGAVGQIPALIATLSGPFGGLALAVILLAAAWVTNFGNIRDVTTDVVNWVGEQLGKLGIDVKGLTNIFAELPLAIRTVDLALKALEAKTPFEKAAYFAEIDKIKAQLTEAYQGTEKKSLFARIMGAPEGIATSVENAKAIGAEYAKGMTQAFEQLSAAGVTSLEQRRMVLVERIQALQEDMRLNPLDPARAQRLKADQDRIKELEDEKEVIGELLVSWWKLTDAEREARKALPAAALDLAGLGMLGGMAKESFGTFSVEGILGTATTATEKAAKTLSGNAKDYATTMMTELAEALKTGGTGLFDFIKQWSGKGIDAFNQFMPNVLATADYWVQAFLNMIAPLMGLSGTESPFGSQLGAGMLGAGPYEKTKSLIEQVTEMGNAIKAALNPPAAEGTPPLATAFDKVGTAADDATSKIRSAVDAAVGFSKGLTPGGAKDIMAPGANGPFEAIYRIKDVAENFGKSGSDFQKWADMYKVNQEQAKQMVKLFETGQWGALPEGLIDYDALRASIQEEQQTLANFDALAKTLGESWNLPAEEIRKRLPGYQGTVITPEAATTAAKANLAAIGVAYSNEKVPQAILNKWIPDPADKNYSTQMKSAVDSSISLLDAAVGTQTVALQNSGAALWDIFGVGVVNQAKSTGVLRSAVEEMVWAALAGRA